MRDASFTQPFRKLRASAHIPSAPNPTEKSSSLLPRASSPPTPAEAAVTAETTIITEEEATLTAAMTQSRSRRELRAPISKALFTVKLSRKRLRTVPNKNYAQPSDIKTGRLFLFKILNSTYFV